MNNKPNKILIIDDHRLFADGLSLVLSQSDEYQVSTFYNARTVLDNCDLLNEHDLALVDLDMPGIDGFGFLKGIKERKLKIKVVIVSATDNRADINRILQMGAAGFLPKKLPSDIMLEGVETVLSGDQYVPKSLWDDVDWQMLNSNEKDSDNDNDNKTQNNSMVSARQIEVLNLLRDGHVNKDIAQILDVTESTVKSHISILFKAFNIKNRTACVQKGIALALI